MNMKLENTSKLNNKSDIIVRSLTQPTVTDVKIESEHMWYLKGEGK